jgi:hypothetical protein
MVSLSSRAGTRGSCGDRNAHAGCANADKNFAGTGLRDRVFFDAYVFAAIKHCCFQSCDLRRFC